MRRKGNKPFNRNIRVQELFFITRNVFQIKPIVHLIRSGSNSWREPPAVRRSRGAAARWGERRRGGATGRRALEGGGAAAVDQLRELAVPEVPGDVRAPADEHWGGAPDGALPAALLEELPGGALPIDARLTSADAHSLLWQPPRPPRRQNRRNASRRDEDSWVQLTSRTLLSSVGITLALAIIVSSLCVLSRPSGISLGFALTSKSNIFLCSAFS